MTLHGVSSRPAASCGMTQDRFGYPAAPTWLKSGEMVDDLLWYHSVNLRLATLESAVATPHERLAAIETELMRQREVNKALRLLVDQLYKLDALQVLDEALYRVAKEVKE